MQSINYIFASDHNKVIMLNKSLIGLIVCFLFVTEGEAQRWKKYRQELTFGAGTTWLLGDVGGFGDEPTNTIADINFAETSWGITAGYNYYLTKNISVNGQFMYGWFEANDKHADNEARKHRNFDIRTHIYELGITGRYYFIKEKFGHAFRLKGAQSGFLYGLSAYVTTGITGFYYNPKGRYSPSGKYESLRPIGTEGQTVDTSGLSPYGKFSMAIPLGLGVKYALGTRWNVGAEIMFRKSFTDYLDDVSTDYYDNQAIIDANDGNLEAGLLADPADKTGDQAHWTNAGEARGGPKYDDFYMTFMFTLSYKILKGKSFKPRF